MIKNCSAPSMEEKVWTFKAHHQKKKQNKQKKLQYMTNIGHDLVGFILTAISAQSKKLPT